MTDNQPAAKVGYVNATIFGKTIRFELARSPVAFDRIERVCGSFPATWQRFQQRQHTTRDVRTILATAHPYREIAPDRAHTIVAMAKRLMRETPEPEPKPVVSVDGAPMQVIDNLMRRVPFGGWEELAAIIMAACINGLDPAVASFTYPPPAQPLRAAAE